MTLDCTQISAISVFYTTFYDVPLSGYGIYRGQKVKYHCTKQAGYGLDPNDKRVYTEKDWEDDLIPFYNGEYNVEKVSALEYWSSMFKRFLFRVCWGGGEDRELHWLFVHARYLNSALSKQERAFLAKFL